MVTWDELREGDIIVRAGVPYKPYEVVKKKSDRACLKIVESDAPPFWETKQSFEYERFRKIGHRVTLKPKKKVTRTSRSRARAFSVSMQEK